MSSITLNKIYRKLLNDLNDLNETLLADGGSQAVQLISDAFDEAFLLRERIEADE